MCGITGFYDTAEAASKAKQALAIMKNRGLQAAGLYDGMLSIEGSPEALPYSGSVHALGHVLHAMVGCVPQPVQGSGVLVANCEIYNWKELAQEQAIDVRNDTGVLLHLLDTLDIHAVLEKLDGVYAFAYERDGTVTLCRDLLGVKPLFYSMENGFAFASERKALELQGYVQVRELYPRTILHYNTKKIVETQREFFAIEPEHADSYDIMRERVGELLTNAITKRIPEDGNAYGILLSGGVDSSTIAYTLREHKPRCYVVGEADSPDVVSAKTLAAQLGLPLTVLSPSADELAAALPIIVNAIEDANPVKTSVAATFWFACEQAQKDGVRALFSGLGSEEVFAGYERHRKSTAVNKECLAGLRKLHERDLYRDDVITMRHNIELRLPFLDKALVSYALKIPAQYKITENDGKQQDKWILRDAAVQLGVPHENALRAKKAAQYGSRIMKQLEKLSKGHDSVAAYLNGFFKRKNKKLAALLSTGKDSVLALHIMHRMQYDITCLVTMDSENPDSFMYHTPNVALATLQAQSMNIPLLMKKTAGKKEEELDSLREALAKAKEIFGVEGVVTGAIQSQYQRERIEKIADELGMTAFSPLWQMNQEHELRTLLADDFDVVFIKVAAEGLDASWLGQHLTDERVDQLVALQQKNGVHPAGEGGEYESIVLDAPLFTHKIAIEGTEIIKDGQAFTLKITSAGLVPK